MKKHIVLLSLVVHSYFSAIAQDSSLDNYTGNWTDDASWTSGTAPPFDNVIEDLTIYGYITLQAGNRIDLTNGGGDVLTIEDTLVIADAGLTSRFFAGNTVVVNGLLIVMGNLNLNTGTTFTVNSGGVVAVGGNFGAFGGGDPTFGAGTVYVEGTSGYTDVSPADDLEGDGLGNVGDFLDGTSTELPVEMKYFKTEVRDGIAILRWATSSELNNAGFDVERSENGIDFRKIGYVGGHGTVNTEKKYSFSDYFFDGRSYYRLKQIDYDGAYEYSEVVEAKDHLSQNADLAVYPNPVYSHENLQISLGGIEGDFFSLKLTSISGQIIFIKDRIEIGEVQSVTLYLQKELVKQGLYTLQITSPYQHYYRQILIK
ncbi:MAG: T9SS type A sorting domain-containing protein [Reichenbachiella sp.]|uniref:T9SS type A sorting domain-containing protein n=1 Tax=Reichenbachiella sp. TaxID=2184521 RepID=UPI0032650AA6